MAMIESARSAARRKHGPTQIDLDEDEMRDAAPTRTGCLLCDWVHEGTALAGREAALAHRSIFHPDLPLTSGRKRKRKPARPARPISLGGRPSLLDPAQEAELVALYRGGYPLEAIVRERWKILGYASETSLKSKVYKLLRREGIELRRRQERTNYPKAA